jgi:hypothetical protein
MTKTKIAFAAALVLGTTTAAFAEDSSSSFGLNVYPQGAQQQVLTGRNVALSGRNGAVERQGASDAQRNADHASSPYAGGGF